MRSFLASIIWTTFLSALFAQPVLAGDAEEEQIDWAAARESHWAWQPVKRPEVPSADSSTVINAIDSFVSARRKQAGLPSNELAPLHVLARRIYVDLVGVVPAPQQVEHFVDAATEDRQQAVASLVDELLLSPMYGQRWARHWLDVARYSEGRGGFLDNKSLDHAWRYRDWVVNALNEDLPINEFLKLQIAGDLIAGKAGAIATGFFAVGPTYISDGGDPNSVAQAKGETLDDRVDTLTRGLMGITVSCARCHDHKFDPIPQQDYYSLAGVFNNSETHRISLGDPELVEIFDEHEKKTSELKEKIRSLKQKFQQEAREPSKEEAKQRNQWQADLAELEKNAPPDREAAHTLRDTGASDMHLAVRGDLRKQGELAPRRFLRIACSSEPKRFSSGSGRAELADAIVDPSNPLTARVFVNRVWMHHFGEALVRTPSNFGTLGEPPTHPLLLDWLAADFVESGWSLKRLHRLIMTSATYQLSSAQNADCFAQDGDNRLLWRMNPRRMDVEAWRDSLLEVCGDLDCAVGGPSVADISKNNRRTLYAKVSRNGDSFESDEFLRRFDFPMMRATVAKRPSSIVPQQFLFLLNSPFMVTRAKSLVGRLTADAPTDEERIQLAYQLLYNRSPDDGELRIAQEFLDSGPADADRLSSWEQYAQTLLSSNEFMFVR